MEANSSSTSSSIGAAAQVDLEHARKSKILGALHKWVAQRPGLNSGNYGDMRSYRSEMRSITRDGNEARRLLGAIAWRDSITADSIIEGAKHAYSGRLSIEETPKGVRIDYCTGQYWPTEYRAAVAVLCASLLWDYHHQAQMD